MLFSLNGGKITKSREQNKETCFFFCRDAVISPSFGGKITKKQQNTQIYLCISLSISFQKHGSKAATLGKSKIWQVFPNIFVSFL